MKRILITGANSYIGTSFEKYMKQFEEYSIDTLDMMNPSWKEYDFFRYDVVFHVAGIAHSDVSNPSKEMIEKYYHVNTNLTVEVAKKAKESNVRQFIFMSSMIVYGDSTPMIQEKIITHKTKEKPANFYGNSKLKADLKLQELEDDSFTVTIVRPPMVYGKGSKGNFNKLIKFVQKIHLFPYVINCRSFVEISDLCNYIKTYIDKREGGIVFPTNENMMSTSELVTRYCENNGINVSATRLFNPIISIVSRWNNSFGKTINKIFGNFTYSDQGNSFEEKLVSIIMPAYNAEKYITKAIESVKAQTYSKWELIVANDASTDDTKSIIQNYANLDNRIKLVNMPTNQGAASARNAAVKVARGQFVAFLDSDDLWTQNKLEKQIAYMNANDIYFSCTYYDKINSTGEKMGTLVKYPFKVDYKGLLKRCPGNSTVIYDASILGKSYIPLIKKRNDYIMWLQMIKRSTYLYCLEENLSSHRIVENSLSSNKFDLIKYHWNIYRKYEKISVIHSLYLVMFWCLKSVFRKMK